LGRIIFLRVWIVFLTYSRRSLQKVIKIKCGVLGVALLAIALLSGCVAVEMKRAQLKLSGEKYDEAIPLYQKVLSKNSDSVKARSRLGFAYLKTGRIEQAVVEFKKVLAKEPGEPFSVLYLGLAYLNQEEIKKTIALWQGYKSPEQPLVEAEIKRQITLLQIADSQQMAKKALAAEKQLTTVKPPANTIAISQYKDMSPDKSMGPFQKGLAAMVTTDLSKIKSLKVVERIRLQALMNEMALGITGVVDEKSAPRIGRLVGAHNLVVGTIRPGSIEAVTTVGGKSSSARVETKDFWKLPLSIIQTIVTALNITLTAAEEQAIGTIHTKSLVAFTYYGAALLAQDAGKWQEALDLFGKAIEADPGFMLAIEANGGSPGPATTSTAVEAVAATAEAAVSAAAGADADAAGASAADATAGSLDGSSGEGGGGGGGGP
jgi:tetratricopeptide (TPR) repeat protein